MKVQNVLHLSEVKKKKSVTRSIFHPSLRKMQKMKPAIRNPEWHIQLKKKSCCLAFKLVADNTSFCSNSLNLKIVLQGVVSAHLLIQTKNLTFVSQ